MTSEPDSLLPDDFRESLALLPKNKPVTLLTRHSIREQAENYNAHHSLPLTKEGEELALLWGAMQPFDDFQLFSSPVGRCVETAKHMYRGKRQQEEVRDTPVEILGKLTEPGCFIRNREVMKTVGKVFIEHGPIMFLNRIMSGEFNHLLSVEETMKSLLLQFRQGHSQEPEKLNIHVSHDTILAAFVYTLLGKTELEDSDWPRMMEGVYLWLEHDRVHAVWRAEKFECALNRFIV